MALTNRYRGLFHFIAAHWPRYLIGFGGGTLLNVLVIVFSLNRGWYSFLLLGVALLLVLLYLAGASLWTAHRLHDDNLLPDLLFSLGDLDPQSEMTYINLGSGDLAASLSRQLTTGKLLAIDIYNPQLAPSRPLARQRQQSERRNGDPRLSSRDGQLNLLPLPDNSTACVILALILTELWQEGDRRRLLREVRRVLAPNGLLLVAEPVRSVTSLLVLSPGWTRLKPAGHWREVLAQTGFDVVTEGLLNDQIWCCRSKLVNAQRASVQPSAA